MHLLEVFEALVAAAQPEAFGSLVNQQLSGTLDYFARRRSAAAGASKAVLDAGGHPVEAATVMHEAQARAAAVGIVVTVPNDGVVLNMLAKVERS